jgi:hypothetical protein
MPPRQGEPYSEMRRSARIDGRWQLTHAVWHNSFDVRPGCPETGVRDLEDVDSKTGRPRFDLIQHGWWDFDRAEAVIAKGLRKGWSPFRISEAMERARNWGRARAPVM